MGSPGINIAALSVAIRILAVLLCGGCDTQLRPTTERDTRDAVGDQGVELETFDKDQADTVTPTDTSDLLFAADSTETSDVPLATDLSDGEVPNTCPVAVGGLRNLSEAVDVDTPPTHLDMEFGRVELLGARSYDEDGDSIAEQKWTVTQHPGRVPPSVEQVSARGPSEIGIYMLGSYELELTVVDEHGLSSCNTAGVTVTSTATAGLVVELTWETPGDPDETDDDGADVDLHLLRPGGMIWNLQGARDDCFFYDRSPDWGVLGVATDNPKYHVDDFDGAGPEVITIEQPALTTGEEGYLIGVNFRVNNHFALVFPSVRVYSNGEAIGIVGEKGGIALQRGEVWIAGELFWTENGPLFVTSDVPQITDGFPVP
ncbi:MAG: hypothetical protein AUK47_10795 [Deltaproteobacteria bacterium CG2_30_63_29]|nr:MAG: hypothetical protein AUK47_10795 [Deltaproteobacteria bacterium CG2_30_63_29]